MLISEAHQPGAFTYFYLASSSLFSRLTISLSVGMPFTNYFQTIEGPIWYFISFLIHFVILSLYILPQRHSLCISLHIILALLIPNLLSAFKPLSTCLLSVLVQSLYIYIYRERERERVQVFRLLCSSDCTLNMHRCCY